MRQGLLIGLGSGLASALLFFSAARGGVVLGHILFMLTPLPPFLAGLGWGWLSAAGGALAGMIAVAAAASLPEGMGYLLAVGLPAVLVAYLGYLSRPSDSNPDAREWYPPGRLLAALSLYAGALPVLVLPLIGGSYDALRPILVEPFKEAIREASDLRLKGLGDAQLDALGDLIVAIAPAGIAAEWLLIVAANAYLAGRIAVASGRLARDWPDLPAFAYPGGFSLLLGLAAVVAWLGSGAVRIAGMSFGGALLSAHLLAGLALVHFLARRGARWLLWVVYTGLLVPRFFPYAVALVTLAGVVEPVLKLKQRLGTPPPLT
jgi:hypothetical protein